MEVEYIRIAGRKFFARLNSIASTNYCNNVITVNISLLFLRFFFYKAQLILIIKIVFCVCDEGHLSLTTGIIYALSTEIRREIVYIEIRRRPINAINVSKMCTRDLNGRIAQFIDGLMDRFTKYFVQLDSTSLKLVIERTIICKERRNRVKKNKTNKTKQL